MTIYGDTTNHWRAYLDTWSSEDGKSVSAGCTVGIQACGWGFQINSGISGTANAGGSSNSGSGGFSVGTGSWGTKALASASKTFAKGHSAYTATLSGSVTNSSGYMNGTSSCSMSITVPALASHTYSFNANGGSGAPGSATKWYGEQLTIPTGKPTRANYQFLGWSSTSGGSVQYEPGKSYWVDDVNTTLYAVWKLLYKPPEFSAATAIRTSSNTSTTNSPTGDYAYASFTWKVDTSVYSDNKASSIKVVYYANNSSSGTTATLSGTTSGTSGTVTTHFAAALASLFNVVCTVTDAKGGSVSISRLVPTGSIPIDVSNLGKSVGIGATAPSKTGVNVGSGSSEVVNITGSAISLTGPATYSGLGTHNSYEKFNGGFESAEWCGFHGGVSMYSNLVVNGTTNLKGGWNIDGQDAKAYPYMCDYATNLNTCGRGRWYFDPATTGRPKNVSYGAVLCFGTGSWLFQLMLPTGGAPAWRRNINNGGWTNWWTIDDGVASNGSA